MTPRDAVARSLLSFEGIDSNHPSDHGGLTHYGLTLASYQGYRPGSTSADLLALSFDQVLEIITEVYALRPGYWRIDNEWVMWAVIDCAINSGPREATKQLQRALGVTVDGVFGRETVTAVNALPGERIFRRVMASRVRHYGQIIRKDHSQAVFAGGWLDRVASILEVA